MSQLQQLQGPIDQAIFGEVLGCLPDEWTKTVLNARISSEGPDGTSISLRLDACGQEGIAIVSDELQAKVRQLFLLNAKFQTELQAIVYRYERDPKDGRWNFEADYEYP